jgi:hypothetical protein
MKKTALIVALTSLMALAANSASADLIWDVTSDFSIANGNPNGAWSYGWVNGSSFQAYSSNATDGNGSIFWLGDVGSDRTPDIWKNYGAPIHGVGTGQLSLHPGPGGQASVARWTAPAGIGSPVQVQGQFYPGDSGVMQVGIFVDGIPQVTTPYWQSTNSGTFDFSLPVSAGSTIDFAVYGGYDYGNTPLEATITAVPEPSTLVLLGVGAIGLFAYGWRRRQAT